MGASTKLLFLLGLGIAGFLTNPYEKKKFNDQLQERTKRKEGFLASIAMRGAAALNFFDIQNYHVFSLAYLNDPQRSTPPLVAFGIFGKWFFNDRYLQ